MLLGEPSQILDALPDPLIVTDGLGTIEWCNPATEESLGYRIDEWRGRSVLEAIHPDDHGVAISSFGSMTERGYESSGLLLTVRVLHADGEWSPCEVRGRCFQAPDGTDRVVINVRNVADRHRESIDQGDPELLRSLVHHSGAVLIRLDAEFRVRAASAAFTRLLGYDNVMVEGRELVSFVAPADQDRVSARLDRLDQDVSHLPIEADFVTQNGAVRRLSLSISDLRRDTVVRGLLVSGMDVTKLRDAEMALRRMAETDALTGLMNRSTVMNEARKLCRQPEDLPLTVLYCDLDGFKEVNDTYGHAVGDATLQEVAARLQRCVHNDDFLARMGGDEFVVVLRNCLMEQGEIVAARIEHAIEPPFLPMGHLVRLGISIGMADATEPCAIEALLASADAAMYGEKRQRRAEGPIRTPRAVGSPSRPSNGRVDESR